jgi:hypothetical protein
LSIDSSAKSLDGSESNNAVATIRFIVTSFPEVGARIMVAVKYSIGFVFPARLRSERKRSRAGIRAWRQAKAWRSIMRAGIAFVVLPWVCAIAVRAEIPAGVTYTIAADEALHGPKPSAPNHLVDATVREATIRVNAGRVVGRVNPLVFGACLEDLNHEIYGGLYAQMIYGESFEEGPEKALPPGWRLHAEWLKRPTWEGMWCAEHDAIGMTGFRWYKLLWEGARFGHGIIECELMQPAFDPGQPIGLLFRAGGDEFREACGVRLDTRRQVLELRIRDRAVAGAPVPCALDEWLPVRVEARDGRIRVFARGQLAIDVADADPLPAGLVGFDATESRGWFRKLRIETGGTTHTPSLSPARPSGYRGPVSQWWEPIVTGEADAAFGWEADRPFNTLRAQKLEHRGGAGIVGVANRGLHRFGLSVERGRTYEGRLHLRGEGDVTVALQSADGSRTYATQRLAGIASDWKKFPVALTADATDHEARFAVWIDRPGVVWVDQVVLMPTGDRLFKGLPVRADIAQAVVDSGVTCIRLGGDSSNPPGFRWKTMLGDPDRRPQYNSCWYPFETRGWGIVEFIAFCRAAGIEPIPCLNHEEAPDDVVELARRYRLKYVQLGNGFAGIERTAAVADALRARSPETKLLSGSIGHAPDVLPDEARLREMKEKLGGKGHALAAFPYNFEVTGHASWQAMLDRLQPHAWTIRMAREHYQPLAVETATQSPRITFKEPIPYGVPAVDALVASAARNERGDALALKVVNFAPFPLRTRIGIAGLRGLSPRARVVTLTGGDLNAHNTAADPTALAPVASARDGIGPDFEHSFPAYSYTILTLERSADANPLP